jgi:UDP-N-acetylmuramate--alanine ligase
VAGVPVVKRGEVLAMLANARRCVAVAGSHGKSTTCGMLVTALADDGADPSYAVGAVIGATGTNAALADGDAMVVEADEFDYAFLWLSPEVAIVTNVEFDHPDIFPDQQSYDAAFAQFATKLRPGGTLVLAADDPGCARLQAKIATNLPGQVVTYGEGETSDWRLDRDAEGYAARGARLVSRPATLGGLPAAHLQPDQGASRRLCRCLRRCRRGDDSRHLPRARDRFSRHLVGQTPEVSTPRVPCCRTT